MAWDFNEGGKFGSEKAAEDYARRKGWTVVEAERWLAPVLNYDPIAAADKAA